MRLYLLLMALLILSLSACAEDTRFDGQALWDFQSIGAWGWYVSVDRVIDGPTDMVGQNISVYLTSANPVKYPPGSIDPNIKIGDKVSVYGALQSGGSGNYHVLLVGSGDYFIKRIDQ